MVGRSLVMVWSWLVVLWLWFGHGCGLILASFVLSIVMHTHMQRMSQIVRSIKFEE